jgi:hypothetical protein
MSESSIDNDKEYEPINKRIQERCLSIFDSVNLTEKKYLKSSHGIARRTVDRMKDDAAVIPEVDSADYFDELLEGGQ